MIVSSAGVQLEAEASPPTGARKPAIVLAHPHPRMGGAMQNKVIDQIYRRSVEKGWGVVRFNFRGVGASTGSYDFGNGELDDLLGVFRWAQEEFERTPGEVMIVGYSFGAWIAAKAAAALSEIARLILIAPPVATMDFSPLQGVRHVKHLFAASQDEFAALDATRSWFEGLSPPKAIHVVEGADHFFVGHTAELVRAVVRVIDQD